MAANAHDVIVVGSGGGNEASLLEVLDHVINSGVVIHGSLVISLAGVDLVYVGLNVILTSVETALRHLNADAARRLCTPSEPKAGPLGTPSRREVKDARAHAALWHDRS